MYSLSSRCRKLLFNYIRSLCRGDELCVVSKDGDCLGYVNPEFLKDHEFMRAAIKNEGEAMKWVTSDLKDDINMTLIALTSDGHALEHLSTKFRATCTSVLNAVTNGGTSFKYAAKWLQDELDLALVAVEQCGLPSELLSHLLRAHHNIALKAVADIRRAIKYAHLDLLECEEDIALVVLLNDPGCIADVPMSILRNRPALIAAVSSAVLNLSEIAPVRTIKPFSTRGKN